MISDIEICTTLLDKIDSKKDHNRRAQTYLRESIDTVVQNTAKRS